MQDGKRRQAWAKAHLKRVPLDVHREDYPRIRLAADRAGETVNGYIRKAIDQRIARDGG